MSDEEPKPTTQRRIGDLAPDPERWEALENGGLLREILEDFYTRVYDDPRLNHFFDGTTKERAIDKQYNFLFQTFTGENVYFGNRPRNAHHWMVISDELFDYREALFLESARRHGLAENLLARWAAVHQRFRK